MQAFCERNQQQAIAELQQLSATNGNIPESAFKPALSGCVRDWPGDFAMQSFCVKNQIEGYNTTARGPSTPLAVLSPEEATQIRAFCTEEWPGDFQMQAYCQEQQADGVAYLHNRPPTVSAIIWDGARQYCVTQWPSDFQMQAYCVRQSF